MIALLGSTPAVLAVAPAWATAGGGAGKVGRLLDKVFDHITSQF